MRGESLVSRRYWHDEQGAISVLAAFVLVAVVGVSALALEYGHALLQKVENQRAADLAAYGGALVYNSTGSTDSATSAANNIAALNGLSSGVTPSYVSSPSGDGNHAIKVTATTNLPLHLARVLTSNTTLPVSATAYAEINSSAPGCIIALANGGTGIVANGGTHITANNCAVASNNAVTLSGSAALVTKTVDYRTTHSATGGASISPPSGTPSVTYSNITTSDPLSGNSAVSADTSHISTVSAMTSPSAPTISPLPSGGKALSFAYSVVPASSLPANCTDSFASNTHTVTCSGNGPFNIASLSLGGGLKLNFNKTGSSNAVYNFSSMLSNTSGDTMAFGPGTFTVNGSITNSGTLSFGAGTFKVNGSITNNSGTLTFGSGSVTATNGIATGGGTTTTFGAGTFTLGEGTASCNGSSGYSICNTGTTLTFAGPSTFVLSGGIYNGGGETLTLGSTGTTTNSYNIGAANDGNSIYAGGGANDHSLRRHRRGRSVSDSRQYRQQRRHLLVDPCGRRARH
jgi:Flp pilus assembly protein TadG